MLTAQLFISLDGVVQAPGDPEEDRSGGFDRGGWHLPLHDDVAQRWIVRNNEAAAGYLLGRRTYDFFARFWPQATADQVGPLAEHMNEKPKWVVSSTLSEPLGWAGSTVVSGSEPASAVRALLARAGGDLLVLGSTRLTKSLLAAGLIERLCLVLDPLVVGEGERLFAGDGANPARWDLADCETTPKGAVLLTYVAA